MKRFLALLLTFALFLPLLGCHSQDSGDTVFYYCRNTEDYRYFEENSVVCPEERDLTGHQNDLRYMVGLYLAGPLDEELHSPFSASTRLISVKMDGQSVFIELSDQTGVLNEPEFTLACACLTLSCMRFISCTDVTITSAERSITMNEDSIVLFDSLPMQETTGG